MAGEGGGLGTGYEEEGGGTTIKRPIVHWGREGMCMAGHGSELWLGPNNYNLRKEVVGDSFCKMLKWNTNVDNATSERITPVALILVRRRKIIVLRQLLELSANSINELFEYGLEEEDKPNTRLILLM
jgi:hypothetical protein